MKKIISILMAIFLMPFAFAQELPDAGTTPDSPVYFIDTIADDIDVALTTGEQAKNEKRLRIAEERLAEYELMYAKGKTTEANKAMIQHQKQTNNIEKNKNKLNAQEKKEIQVRLYAHKMKMEQLAAKLPEQAQAGLRNAIQNTERHITRVQEGLPKEQIMTQEQMKTQAQEQIAEETRERAGSETGTQTETETRTTSGGNGRA